MTVAPAPRAAGTPVVIDAHGGRQRLERLSLASPDNNEAWLQALVFEHPELLPVTAIESGFGEIFAIAREVPCGHGFIDNLYVTATGEIVLVEAKLWQNPQARREVVAQCLDYVAALTRMGFENLEAACRRGQGMAAQTLFGLVAEQPDALSEQAFVDAVSLNLRRGRVLVIALGDGIRAETQALAELLQSHAGAHFTFALVELACWRNPVSGDIVALPSTLARTAMITRGVVRVEEGAAHVYPVAASLNARPKAISDELFFEELGKKAPPAPALVQAFLTRLEPLGIYADLKASLNLKADLPGASRATNFGYVTKGGKLWTDALSWTAPADIAQAYNTRLAELIGGVVTTTSKGSILFKLESGAGPRITDMLPQHEDAWLVAIAETIEAIRAAASDFDD